jgi:hypothetical protein
MNTTRLVVFICFFISLILNPELNTGERVASSVAEQKLMSSALRRTILSVAERDPSSDAEPQLLSSALRRTILYCRAGCVIGRWVPINVVRSKTHNTVLQSGVRHRSLSPNWCRPLYDAQYCTAERGASSVAESQLMSSALRRAILYCRSGRVIGRWAAIDVFRSKTYNPALTRNSTPYNGPRHRSV